MIAPTVISGARAELAATVGALHGDAAVVAVAEIGARVVDAEGLAALVEELGDHVLSDGDGQAWIGRAACVAAALAGQAAVTGDDSGAVVVVDGTGTDIVMAGRMLVAASPRSLPVVVLGDESALVGVDRLLATDTSDDLARVIGYRDAVADGPLIEVGSELLAVPFWTAAMCRAVVAAAEAADAWGSDESDPVPGEEISIATISPLLFGSVESHLQELILPLVRVHWPLIDDAGVHDAFVIKYGAASANQELPLHHDLAQISGSLRLNEGYLGGELEFPRQGYSNRELPVGTLLLWPSLVTHPHRSATVRRGVKYGLTVWLRLPGG